MSTTSTLGERLSSKGGVIASATEPERKLLPVKWWATLGAAVLALQIYLVVAWLLGGPTPTEIGPNVVPEWQKIAVHALEAISVVAYIAFMYFVVVRPARHEGRLTTDGVLALVFSTLCWTEPMIDAFVPTVSWNSEFVNLGSWAEYLPGWLNPAGEHIVVPLLFIPFAYCYCFFGMVLMAGFFMRKAKERWPRIGPFGLCMVSAGFIIPANLFAEVAVLTPLGLISWTGTITEFTIFAGTYHQYPLYETIFFTFLLTSFACLRFFRNEKGQTFAERGIDQLVARPWQKTFISYLAFTAVCAAIYMVAWILPMALIGMHADNVPAPILEKRAYNLNQQCGPGTDYACPGPSVPIPKAGSRYVTPDGQLSR